MKPEWKSLSTAPKDATRILTVCMTDEGPKYSVVRFENARWTLYGDPTMEHWLVNDDLFEKYPTFWMHLPDYPR